MDDQNILTRRYERLNSQKSQVLQRGRDAALFTIPAILPPEGHTENSPLRKPYQGMGARAVNTLAAKMLLALFPPNTSFFKINPDDQSALVLQEEMGEQYAELQKKLSQVETLVVSEIEQTRMRSTMSTCFKHLIVTGNYVLHVGKQGAFRGFGLNHYVVNRDPEGNVIELVIREKVSPEALDDEILQAVFSPSELKELKDSPNNTVTVYTGMRREGNRYKVHQEINKHVVPGSQGTYPLDAPPFIVLRWTTITDEDYGRGLVDEYIGDFVALDCLSRDIQKASAAAAKVVFTLDPNSHMRPKDLTTANSGDVLRGRASDVGTISLDKFADFRITLEEIRDLKQDISEAFLMHSSIQRDAERVTAEEIRFMAQELEDALGGVYSVLAQELQAPLVRRFMNILGTAGKIPQFKKEDIKLSVSTGLEALGRGHAVNKLRQFLGMAREALGESVMERINDKVVLSRLAEGLAVIDNGLIMSEEDYQQKQAAAQQQALAQSIAPGAVQEAIKQGGIPNG